MDPLFWCYLCSLTIFSLLWIIVNSCWWKDTVLFYHRSVDVWAWIKTGSGGRVYPETEACSPLQDLHNMSLSRVLARYCIKAASSELFYVVNVLQFILTTHSLVDQSWLRGTQMWFESWVWSSISVEPCGTQKTRRHFHFDICIIIIYGLLTVPDLDISVVYNNYLYFLNIGDTLLCL